MLIGEIEALKALGFNPEQLKNTAKNWQGYPVTAVIGTVTQNIQVPGTAIALMGIVIEGTQAGDTMNVKLNNEIVYQNVSAGIAAETSISLFPNGYLEITRKLTGTDVFTLEYTSAAGGDIQFNIAYLTNYNVKRRQ